MLSYVQHFVYAYPELTDRLLQILVLFLWAAGQHGFFFESVIEIVAKARELAAERCQWILLLTFDNVANRQTQRVQIILNP